MPLMRIMLMILSMLFAPVRLEENLSCIVTQHHDKTVCEIVGDTKPLSAPYDWADGTDTVLANHQQSNELVLQSNGTHLVMKNCVEGIYRRIDCYKQEKDCVVHCNVNCTITPSVPVTAVPLSGGQITGIVIGVVLVLVVMLLGLVCRFFNPCSKSAQETEVLSVSVKEELKNLNVIESGPDIKQTACG